MFNKEQIVKIKWNNTNREWFESKGYIYTKRYDTFDVKASDLMDKSMVKIIATCDYCGNEYETSYCVIKKAIDNGEKNACKHCASTKVGDKTKAIRIEKRYRLVNDQCAKRGYSFIGNKEDLANIKSYIYINTPSGIQTVQLDNFLRGHDCFSESYKNRNYNRISEELIDKTIKDDGNEWINTGDYTNCTDRCLNIRCACGSVFTTSFINYTKSNVRKCPSCSAKQSSGENSIENILEDMGISYEKEKRFADCKDKKPLPFDFYLSDYNLVIEFDGQNHYYPIFDTHDITVVHDKMKDEYCRVNGINILRIPYWDGHNIKEIISNKISNLKI